MDDEIEKQVERALAAFNKLKVPASWDDELLPIFRDLLAGKFKEEPLPEIARPPWSHVVREVIRIDGEYFVSVHGNGEWTSYRGPFRKSARAAIEAWNAVFAKRDER